MELGHHALSSRNLRPALRRVRVEGRRLRQVAQPGIITCDMDRHTFRQTLIGVAIVILALIALALLVDLLVR